MRGPDESKPTCEFHVGLLSEDDGFLEMSQETAPGRMKDASLLSPRLSGHPVLQLECCTQRLPPGGGGAQMCNRRNLRFEPLCGAYPITATLLEEVWDQLDSLLRTKPTRYRFGIPRPPKVVKIMAQNL